MKKNTITFCLTFLCLTAIVSAQTVVTNGLILNNDRSTIRVVNPNTTGSFILQLPVIPNLQPGEQQQLVLKMTGTENGTSLAFVPAENSAQPDVLAQRVDVTSLSPSPLTQKTVHTFAEIDLPSILPADGFVVKISNPAIKAGAAISVSPAAEMPTGLFPAFAWCPIDCVVMIKFMNIGPAQVDLPAMQFAIGAINPVP